MLYRLLFIIAIVLAGIRVPTLARDAYERDIALVKRLVQNQVREYPVVRAIDTVQVYTKILEAPENSMDYSLRTDIVQDLLFFVATGKVTHESSRRMTVEPEEWKNFGIRRKPATPKEKQILAQAIITAAERGLCLGSLVMARHFQQTVALKNAAPYEKRHYLCVLGLFAYVQYKYHDTVILKDILEEGDNKLCLSPFEHMLSLDPDLGDVSLDRFIEEVIGNINRQEKQVVQDIIDYKAPDTVSPIQSTSKPITPPPPPIPDFQEKKKPMNETRKEPQPSPSPHSLLDALQGPHTLKAVSSQPDKQRLQEQGVSPGMGAVIFRAMTQRRAFIHSEADDADDDEKAWSSDEEEGAKIGQKIKTEQVLNGTPPPRIPTRQPMVAKITPIEEKGDRADHSAPTVGIVQSKQPQAPPEKKKNAVKDRVNFFENHKS